MQIENSYVKNQSYADRHVENPYDRTWSIAAARFIVQFTFKQSLRP